ncbi:MAG: efflux RND transporter periplasmic adaptor subunit [Candidatus Aminicenantes bacterium]|nr:efflux RND transporter periplasmic adaptor subunit [Candidatus Aminicenantes bacterium]
MTKKKLIYSGLALLLLLSLLYCRPQEQEEIQEESFGAALVTVFKVSKQRISEKLVFTGVIEAWQTMNITPEIGGRIAKIFVEEGDRVRKGQLLAELDTRAARLQVEQAEAAVAVAQANYNDAEKNMERMERLIKENAVSEQQYEKIKLAFESAEAQFNQAQAALNLSKYNLDVSIMEAPFSGVVASKNAEVGDVINPMMGGFSPTSGVVTLMNFSRVKIEVDVSYQDVVRIKKGQPASMAVSAFHGRIFPGRVSVVNLTADPMTKKFHVEIAADNPDLLLRPNTFGEIMIEVSSHEDALVVPQNAILENKYVFVVNEDNTVRRQEVSLGLENTDMVEIISGVQFGDRVVVEGSYGLDDGTKIEIKEVIQ